MHGSSSSDPLTRRSLRLATAPVNWNNTDIPGWRPVTPFPEILDRMREAGYTATEYDGAFGDDPEQLIREASMRGITWVGCYQWVDFLDGDNIDQTIRDLQSGLQLLSDIGCPNLIVADLLRPHRVALAGRVPADGSESLSDDDVTRLADGVHRLAEAAARYSLAVRFHNHVGSWIEAPHEVEALLERLDTTVVDLCFDTGHYAYGGGDAASFIRDHFDSIGYLHLKDVDTKVLDESREQQRTFIEALRHYVFSPIGRGTADIPAILDTLVSKGFDGWVVVEQDTCEGDATATARENLQFITDWLAQTTQASAAGRETM